VPMSTSPSFGVPLRCCRRVAQGAASVASGARKRDGRQSIVWIIAADPPGPSSVRE
jgi:hypothetical protein